MPYERELESALRACQQVKQLVLAAYSRFTPIEDAAADIKLSIDRETQESLLQQLDAAFPTDSFCAEEDTAALAHIRGTSRNPQRCWIIDPIDGTRGFARKNGEFSVMVALVEKQRVVVGVVLEPVVDRVTYAAQGSGCWVRQGNAAATPCRVTGVSQLDEAALVQSRPSNPGRRSRWLEVVRPARVVQTYSAGIKLALVARGEVELYVNSYAHINDWDICAGQVLVEEAGGRVTTRTGEEILYARPGAVKRPGLLASNGLLHQQTLALLRQVD